MSDIPRERRRQVRSVIARLCSAVLGAAICTSSVTAFASPCAKADRHLPLAPPPANLDITSVAYPGCFTVVLASIPGCERCKIIWAALEVKVKRLDWLGAVMLEKPEWDITESPIAEVARAQKLTKVDADFPFPVGLIFGPDKVVIEVLDKDAMAQKIDDLEQHESASNPTAPSTSAPIAPGPLAISTSPTFDMVTAGVFGVATMATTFTALFGVKALTAHAEDSRNPSPFYQDVASRSALVADVFLPIAIAAGATGGVLLWIRQRAPEQSSAKTFLTPYVGPGGGGLVGRWSF